MLELKPGKLYKVISPNGLDVAQEKDLNKVNRRPFPARKLPQNKIFLFVEEVTKGKTILSKILVDDKVFVTYNGYLLEKQVTELSQYERFPSTSSTSDDQATSEC